MITRKDLAPLNDSDLSSGKTILSTGKTKLSGLYMDSVRTSLHGLVLKIILVVLVTVV